MNLIKLGGSENAFTQGGNRLCFIHPTNPNRVVKTLRPDRSPVIKRASHGFPRNLKPARYFDDNWQELRVYKRIESSVGEGAFDVIPRCFGLVDTDCGPGLVTELIKDDDGRVSLSLKQCVWQYGKEEKLMSAVDQFIQRWGELGMPSRNLLLHNIVVQYSASGPKRLLVIDGLGWPDFVPLAYIIPTLARWKAKRKTARLLTVIDQLHENKKSGQEWGIHGWLDEADR